MKSTRYTSRLHHLLLACLSLVSMAVIAEQTAPQEEPFKEINLASDVFLRGDAVPSWTENTAIPQQQQSDPFLIRLSDTQFNVSAQQSEVYVHRATQANQSGALGDAGQIPISFVPQYQKLHLHSVKILRGNESIDQTKTVNVRFLQREDQYERGIYSGSVTAALLIADLRVGDIVDLKYSIEGANPVFNGKFSDFASWDQTAPLLLRKVMLRHPSQRKITWRMNGDFRNVQITPKIVTSEGITRVYFEEKELKALEKETYTPTSFISHRVLQFSEFQTWNEVARWANSLFPSDAPVPDELKQLITRLKALPSDEDRVAEALRWVQSEVRYFSVSIGESSHRPYPPSQVVQRRYGDCKDKTYLLITLLQSLGIKASPVLLLTESRNGISKWLPSPEMFDHAIVQATVGGQVYYLDGTRPSQKGRLENMGMPMNGYEALVANPNSTFLTTITAPKSQNELTELWQEVINLPKFGEPGTLELTRSWDGSQADAFRAYLAEATPEQLAKYISANLEKRYPKIDMVGAPKVKDDTEKNHLSITTNFKIPKLEVELNGGWGIKYFPGFLQGMFNIPENLKRNFPVAIYAYPYQGNYTLTINWPDTVAFVADPYANRVTSEFFETQFSFGFRGNQANITFNFSAKKPEVPVKELNNFVADIEKINQQIGSMVVVDQSAIKSKGILGLGKTTLQDTMKSRTKALIDRYTKAIESGRLKGEDLAETYCSRAESLADYENPKEGLKDAEQAIKVAPEFARAWFCRGQLHYDNGNFAAAIPDMSKALSLGHDEFSVYYRRGVAKYFLGKYDQASKDLAQAVDVVKDTSDQTYASIWLVTSLKLQGKEIPRNILDTIEKSPRGAWPKPALAMLAGVITPEAMQEELKRKTGDDFELSQVEGMYYLGQLYLIQGKPDLAIKEFKKLREKGVTMYTEHVAAGFELRRLENLQNK